MGCAVAEMFTEKNKVCRSQEQYVIPPKKRRPILSPPSPVLNLQAAP